MPRQFLLIVALFLTTTIHAQIHDSTDYKGKMEFSISWGILSQDQWAGLSHKEARNYGSLVDMPGRYTGAAFITWRYYLTNRLAVGAALGLDNQSGRLSYGGPHSSYATEYTDAGHYHREFYTIAAEALYYYERWQDGGVYFMAGAGVTTGYINYSIYPYAKYGFYNRFVPISRDVTHFNAQVTPVGFRTGRRLSAFIELGYGYKGLVCGGVAFRP